MSKLHGSLFAAEVDANPDTLHVCLLTSKLEHTEFSSCWCNPTLAFVDAAGSQYWMHHDVTWEDLRGAAPDATGELSSEAFVRELRNDWPCDP